MHPHLSCLKYVRRPWESNKWHVLGDRWNHCRPKDTRRVHASIRVMDDPQHRMLSTCHSKHQIPIVEWKLHVLMVGPPDSRFWRETNSSWILVWTLVINSEVSSRVGCFGSTTNLFVWVYQMNMSSHRVICASSFTFHIERTVVFAVCLGLV